MQAGGVPGTMASTLQKLRRASGFRTAKAFAIQMGIPSATYARYESSPEKIPLQVAWRLADIFSVSIDVIVGHDKQIVDSSGSEVQRRYEELSPEFQGMLCNYLEFLAQKSANIAQRSAERETRRYEVICARLDALFLSDLDKKDSAFLLNATAAELRNAFRQYLEERSSSRHEYEIQNTIEEIMNAYDRTHGEFDFKGARFRYHSVDHTMLYEHPLNHRQIDPATSNNEADLMQ